MNYDNAELNAIKSIDGDMREDAGIFTAKQLDVVKTKTYDRKTAQMKGLTLVPVATDTPEWAETVTYVTYDQVGMAKIIANYADDLPRADVTGTEHTVRLKSIGDSYGYNIAELRASAATGQDLPSRKAAAARKAIEVKLNQIALVGDAKFGLHGLLTHPNIGLTAVTGGWAAATPAAVLADCESLYSAVRVQSFGVHEPNVFALSSVLLSLLKNKLLPDSGGKSVFEKFSINHPSLTIEEVPEFAGAWTGGKDVALMYERNEDNLTFDVAMPFTQHTAQARNLEIVVPCEARTGGVVVYYPLALTKAEI